MELLAVGQKFLNLEIFNKCCNSVNTLLEPFSVESMNSLSFNRWQIQLPNGLVFVTSKSDFVSQRCLTNTTHTTYPNHSDSVIFQSCHDLILLQFSRVKHLTIVTRYSLTLNWTIKGESIWIGAFSLKLNQLQCNFLSSPDERVT
ncbi:hypothetical protein H5410_052551 [Solanum commersonii]|uniref:Uncharacterized protein n=1 Tax=Solanum commersonii TaxID=4109 RepID=A0A9J5X3Q0_SOLCO|nr:hypothetical protein H5410_052551 [Solanum commersonii]